MASSEIVATPGHAFYERLNTVLNAEKFDQRIEAVCQKYCKSSSGRPSITPGTYFRILLLGYFEGIDSQRGITWRAADSLSFRKFLGFFLSELTPDHATVSRTRRLYAVHTHGEVMKWVLKILRKHGSGRWPEGMHRRDNLAGQRIDAESGAARHGSSLGGLPAAVGRSRRHRAADPRAVGATRPQAQEEGFERRLDQSERPVGAHPRG